MYVSSVQVLRVVRLAHSDDKSYIFSLRSCQFRATTLYFSIVVSLPRCQDDLPVLTLVHDSKVLSLLQFEFYEEKLSNGTLFTSHICHGTSQLRDILVHFAVLDPSLRGSQFHELLRQREWTLRLLTSHTHLLSLTLDATGVMRNLQCS